MKRTTESRIPHFDTVEEEAEFWDTHSITEFEDELEEVTDVKFVPVRYRRGLMIHLDPEITARLEKRAGELGVGAGSLAYQWILDRLHEDGKQRDGD